LPFEASDLVAQLLVGFFELLDAVGHVPEEVQQRLDERGAFGVRNRRQFELHAVNYREFTTDQLRLFPELLRSYGQTDKVVGRQDFPLDNWRFANLSVCPSHWPCDGIQARPR